MLSGTIECIKIARKHCRVSQNRGSTVFHKIHKCLQKILGMTPPMASKVRENQKYLNPGPSENTLVFMYFLLILGVILGSPKSDFFVVFRGLDRKVPQGGLKDVFLHPRRSKLRLPDPLRGQFLLTNVLEMYEKL